jgi:hypothetical protein
VVDHIRECLVTDVLLSAVERGEVGCAADEWGRENMTAGKEVVHPFAALRLGHDPASVGDPRSFGLRCGLLEFADIFAVTGV